MKIYKQMIFPLQWQGTYIPVSPLTLSDYLEAPVPLIFGVDTRFFSYFDAPLDVITVDLDDGHLFLPEEKKNFIATKMLPKVSIKIFPILILIKIFCALLISKFLELKKRKQTTISISTLYAGLGPIPIDLYKQKTTNETIKDFSFTFEGNILKISQTFITSLLHLNLTIS